MIGYCSCLCSMGLDTPDRICDKTLDGKAVIFPPSILFFEVMPAAFRSAVTKQCETQTVKGLGFCSVGFVGFTVYPTALK